MTVITPRVLQAQTIVGRLELVDDVTGAPDLLRVEQRGRDRLHALLDGHDPIGLALPSWLPDRFDSGQTRGCRLFYIEEGVAVATAIPSHQHDIPFQAETS